ncbi:MAG: tetratricopeptide repeat protein [bacterium]
MLDTSLYYVIGIALLLLGAIAVLAFLVRRGRNRPDDRELYIDSLRSLLDGNQLVAFHKLKEVVRQNSDNIDAYLRLGQILARRGNAGNAIQIHTELLLRSELTAEQTEAIKASLVDDYIASKQFDKAIELLDQAFDHNPRQRRIGEKLLKLLKQTENWTEAEKVAERLYKQDHDAYQAQLAQVRIRLADHYQAGQQGKRARVLYKSAYHIDGTCAEALARVGDSYLLESRLEDAVKAWRQLVEAHPGKIQLVLPRLEKALFELGQFNALGSILEFVAEKDPENDEVLLALAELQVKKGNLQSAEEYLQQVLDAQPDNQAAIIGLAKLYREQGRSDEAFDILEQLYRKREKVADSG